MNAWSLLRRPCCFILPNCANACSLRSLDHGAAVRGPCRTRSIGGKTRATSRRTSATATDRTRLWRRCSFTMAQCILVQSTSQRRWPADRMYGTQLEPSIRPAAWLLCCDGSCAQWCNEKSQRFIVGSPHGDACLTGRKNHRQHVGCSGQHGGGAFLDKEIAGIIFDALDQMDLLSEFGSGSASSRCRLYHWLHCWCL